MRVLFSILILLLGMMSCTPDREREADLYSAIPKTSPLIIETRDIAKVLTEISQTSVFLDIDSLPALRSFQSELQNLKDIFPDDTLEQFLKDRRIVISSSLSGAGKYDFLFLTTSDPDFEKITGRKLSEQYKYRKKDYSGAEVYTFFSGDKEKFSLSVYKDILLFSHSINLVEEGIRQLNSDFNFKSDPEFSKLYTTANQKDIGNIFIKMEEMPSWLRNLMPLAETDYVAKMGKWAEMDLQIFNKELIMSGILLLPEREAYFPQVFGNIEEQSTEAQNILPASLGLWVSYSFANAGEYYRNYEEYLEKNGTYNRHQQLLSALPFDLRPALLDWVDTEMGMIYTEASAGVANKTAYLKARNMDKALKMLETITDSVYIEGYRGYIIKKFGSDHLLPRLYGRIFYGFIKPYYTTAGDFVLMSDNEAMLKSIINDIEAGKTLGNDESFREFESKVPSRSHIKIIASSPHFLDLTASKLEGSDVEILQKFRKNLRNFQWGAFQVNVEGDAAFINTYILNEARVEEEVIREWNASLESPAAREPQFVLNHINKKYEVLVQDRDHRLYLIDADGRILWKVQVDGPMMSNAVQVDAFRNNKLQLVFNTREHLYMIDRLGRHVEGFPVKLPKAATAAAGIFNYDRARNYRFIVPAGNDLLNYGVNGKAVKGWEFKKADSDIISSPELFTIDRRDAIVILSEKGTLYFLNRRGEERFTHIEDMENLKPPFYLREGDQLKESELLCIGENGKMHAIGFSGVVDDIYLDEANPANYFMYFDDKYIFTSEEKLFVKSDENPWSTETESEISTLPKAMIFRRELYIAAFSESAEQVSLFDKNGKLIKGFPVFAQGDFDMGSLKQDGAINIVVPTDDGTLICYRVK